MNNIKSVCLTEKQAAKYINMSVHFLRYHRYRGFIKGKAWGPKYIRLGTKAIRYLIDDLDQWLENSKGTQHHNF